MDTRPLRNSVERFAATLRSDDEAMAEMVLATGQSLVGIYEELHGIRTSLEDLVDRMPAPARAPVVHVREAS